MAQSFLDFVKSLPEQGNVRSISIEELDEEAFKHGRVTSTGGRSFYSNVRNRSAGVAVVFGSDRVGYQKLQPGPAAHPRQPGEDPGGSPKVPSAGAAHPGTANHRRQFGVQPQVQPLPFGPASRDNARQACLWSHTLRDYDPSSPGPDLYEVCIPEWP